MFVFVLRSAGWGGILRQAQDECDLIFKRITDTRGGGDVRVCVAVGWVGGHPSTSSG